MTPSACLPRFLRQTAIVHGVVSANHQPPSGFVRFLHDPTVFPDLARLHKAALIPFFLQGVAGHPDLNQEDGIHPTAQGYSIVVENVWAVLKPIISRKSRPA